MTGFNTIKCALLLIPKCLLFFFWSPCSPRSMYSGHPSLCSGCLFSWYGKLVQPRAMNAVKSAVQVIYHTSHDTSPGWRQWDVHEWCQGVMSQCTLLVLVYTYVVTLEGLQTFAAVTPWSHGNWAWAHIVCSSKSMPLLKRHYIIVLKLSNEAVFLHFQSDIKDN